MMYRAQLPRSLATPTATRVLCAVTLTVLMLVRASNVLADGNAGHAPVNVAMCRGCHGIPGYRSAFPDVYPVPKLGGQQGAYIVNALQEYRSGVRKHATMRSIAATLNDQQIAALAAYYAGSDK
jgi:cytochrome c553